jgi:hypothetical protein
MMGMHSEKHFRKFSVIEPASITLSGSTNFEAISIKYEPKPAAAWPIGVGGHRPPLQTSPI